MRTVYILLFQLLSISSIFSTDLTLTNVSFTGNPNDKDNPTLSVYLTVHWENAWHTEKNHDGVWLFFKVNHQQDIRTQRHVQVKKTGHALVHNYKDNQNHPDFFVPEHGAGIMIYPKQRMRGNVQWRIHIALDPKVEGIDFSNVVFGNALGIEMVYIPQGPYYLGTGSKVQQESSSSFFEGESRKPLLITSEKMLQVGEGRGNLYYHNNDLPQYRGDVLGPIGEKFPKGFDSFWIMKYEVSQGQYVDFLNSISNTPSQMRSNFGGKMYQENRGTIYFEGGKYKTDKPNRPANFISWDDGCAFADWAGLRPFTELEYEKASRGSKAPIDNDFPWGTDSRSKVSRFYNFEGDLVYEDGIDESQLTDDNRELFGASWFWVMDLSGSLWDRVVSVGSLKGRAFEGTHGDGRLGNYGDATNADWPSNKEGGLGYRGSGYYGYGMRGDPFHHVSDRPYGAWGEGPRSVGYGFRAALSVN